MRGYFGIGCEGISKPMNLGNICRTAHSFGASFTFTVNEDLQKRDINKSDTSSSEDEVPHYAFDSVENMIVPRGCKVVGVELTEDSVDLPSFCHPRSAVYVMGPEHGSLSPQMVERCDYTIKIPMKFCVNVGVAAAIVMYDRILQHGNFPAKPVVPGGPLEDLLPEHFRGGMYTNGVKQKGRRK